MMSLILSPITIFALALCLGVFLFPMLVNIDKQMVLAGNGPATQHDKPVLGGIGIAIVLLTCFSFNSYIQDFAFANPMICLLAGFVCFTGLVSDKKATPLFFKSLTEVACAFMVAASGLRLVSLPFIGTLSIQAQYACTVLIIYGIVNIYKYAATKDGIAIALPVINMLALAVLSFLVNQPGWATLLAAGAGATFSFIQYNRHHEKLSLGNSGSMLVGFLVSVSSIHLLTVSATEQTITISKIAPVAQFPILLTLCAAIPVVYALKTFFAAMQPKKALQRIK